MKQQKGITLVALVITIIILLILAGISIATLQQTNLFGQAQRAGNETKNAAANESNTLNEYSNEINKYLKLCKNYKRHMHKKICICLF